MSPVSFPVLSQTVPDSVLLGLPGDNLDLYAVIDLFQKSKTIEEFEKNLNLEKTGIKSFFLVCIYVRFNGSIPIGFQRRRWCQGHGRGRWQKTVIIFAKCRGGKARSDNSIFT